MNAPSFGNSEKAREFAARYAAMDDDERCIAAGKLMRKTWYSAVLAPDRYDELAAKRLAARPQQIPPWLADPELDSVRTWILMGGRGSGKTRSYNGWVIPEALERPKLRGGFLGPDFKVSVGVGIMGRSGVKTLLDAFDPGLIWKWNDVKNILTLANGSEIHCLSSEYPKSIEGPEFHLYVVDEVAELLGQGGENCVWRKRAEPGIRLMGDHGEPIRKIIAGTPEATPLIKDLHEKTAAYPKRYFWTQLATRDNIANLDAENVEQIYEEAGDSHFAKMKLEGHLILSSPHALLQQEQLDPIRVGDADLRHRDPSSLDLDEVILSVDSNHGGDAKSDECGIHIIGRRGRFAHVFADASVKGGSDEWGPQIVRALIAYPEIEKVVFEDDKSLVKDVLGRVLRDDLAAIGRPVKLVPMSHGNKPKKDRADPVAVEYTLGHVLHNPCRRVPEWADLSSLEWQWVSWNPKLTGPKAKSPDRVDSVVYGVTHLLIVGRQPDSWGAPSATQQRNEARHDPLNRIFGSQSTPSLGTLSESLPQNVRELEAMNLRSVKPANPAQHLGRRRNGPAVFGPASDGPARIRPRLD